MKRGPSGHLAALALGALGLLAGAPALAETAVAPPHGIDRASATEPAEAPVSPASAAEPSLPPVPSLAGEAPTTAAPAAAVAGARAAEPVQSFSGQEPGLRLPVESEAERLLFPAPDYLPPPSMPTGPHAPPRLLWPHTPPDPRVYPLVLAPTVATRVPIPRRGAGNCVRRDEQGRFLGWMDHQQCVFSGRALVTARWVDDFFGDWYEDEATMMVRLMFHSSLAESEGLENRVTLRASTDLPNAEHRLRLIVTDETDDLQPGQDQRRLFGQDESRVSAALRWLAHDRDGLESSFDVGVRGIDPPDLFARYRLRKTWSLTDNAITRLSQTLRYGSDSRERYTPVLDLERALDERTVIRLSNYYDYRADSRDDGFNWTHGVSFSRALSGSRSYSYGLSVAGHTRPEWRGESYGPWAVYRSPFLRPWLYFEVEPHYTWQRSLDWDGVASVLLRVEMQFGWRR